MKKSKYHYLYPALLLLSSLSTITCCKDNDKDKEYFMTNQDFVTQASAINNFEIAAGVMVAGKAQSAEVKAYGQRIANEFTAAQLQLRDVAGAKGYVLANGLQEPLKEKFSTLTGLNGAKFDNEFILLMVQSHQDAMALLESASQTME